MTPGLSPVARKVFDYARDMISECGSAPTLSEISDRFDLRSRTKARLLVDDLVSAGLLVRTAAGERNLDLPAHDAVDLSVIATGALQAELARRDRPFQVPRRAPTHHTRACGAPYCHERVTRGHWLCLRHWLLLPNNLRDELVTANRVRNEPRFADAWQRAKDVLEVAR